MASRAHVIHDYGFEHAGERPRRHVNYYRSSSDPIELPRGQSRDGGSLAVVISAVIASSVVLGGAYALLAGPPRVMASTPTPALVATWQLDAQPQQAALVGALRGPARAQANVETTMPTIEEADAPAPTGAPAFSAPVSPPASVGSREVIIDDRYQLPEPAALPDPKPETYPDPVKTPPDAIGPELDLNKPTPGLDPENPYRD